MTAMNSNGPIQPGREVGNYVCLELIGEGAHAQVWKVTPREDPERVRAMKIVVDPQARRQLRREKLRIKIKHPRIAPLLHADLLAEDWPHVVMPYYAKGSLADEIARHPRGLPEKRVRQLLEDILSGLEAAHAKGVVHRDIKPHNVLIDDADRAVITDFDLSRTTSGTDQSILQSTSLDESKGAGLAGTLAYMAPEVRYGQEATFASDVYSVGVLLFETLTGQRPGGLELPSGRRTDLNDAKFWNVLYSKASLPLGQRYPHAGAMLQALRIGPQPLPPPAPEPPPPRRRSRYAVVGILFSFLVALGGYGIYRWAPGVHQNAAAEAFPAPSPKDVRLNLDRYVERQERVTWSGKLKRIESRGGETHLLVTEDQPSKDVFEAFSRDAGFIDGVADYLGDEEAGYGKGDWVTVTGTLRRRSHGSTFHLNERAPLIEILEIQRNAEPESRVVVGQKRDPETMQKARIPSGLAWLVRNKPALGATVKFEAFYSRFSARDFPQSGKTIEVNAASHSSECGAIVEFPRASDGTFSDYQRDDVVTVEGIVQLHDASTASTPPLRLKGKSIFRQANPLSRVTADGRDEPATPWRELENEWRSVRSGSPVDPERRFLMGGVFEGWQATGDGAGLLSVSRHFFQNVSRDFSVRGYPTSSTLSLLYDLKVGDEIGFEVVPREGEGRSRNTEWFLATVYRVRQPGARHEFDLTPLSPLSSTSSEAAAASSPSSASAPSDAPPDSPEAAPTLSDADVGALAETPDRAPRPSDVDATSSTITDPPAASHPETLLSVPALPELTLDLGAGVKMELVLVPAGKFTMGSPESEEGHVPNELPHAVEIRQSFYLSKYEVTQAQWMALMKNDPTRSSSSEYSWRVVKGTNSQPYGRIDDEKRIPPEMRVKLGLNPSHFPESDARNGGVAYVWLSDEDNLPVENVSWEDCQAFCRALLDLRGRKARLPTEAEWEYACRAGTTTPFHFGDVISTDQANYEGKTHRYPQRNGPVGERRDRTTPVGSFAPNAWGLHDMHGNVKEWCSDWYGLYLSFDQEDPAGPQTGKTRIARGGSWEDAPTYCRGAYRDKRAPLERSPSIGFRVVVEP